MAYVVIIAADTYTANNRTFELVLQRSRERNSRLIRDKVQTKCILLAIWATSYQMKV